MDQLIKESLLFKDMTTAFTIWEATIAMLLSFFLSLWMGMIYQKTHKGVSYSSTFVQTLIIMSVVVSVIMLIIGSNIARAFSLVGALSIIRFRTAIKDPRDVGFVFLVMAIGMAAGTRFYATAVVFTILISLIIFTLHRFRVGEKKVYEQLLRIQAPRDYDFDGQLGPVLSKHTESFRLAEVTTSPDGQSHFISYIVRLVPKTSVHEFLKTLRDQTRDSEIQLLSGEDQITI